MAIVKVNNKIPLVGGKAIEVTEAQITTEPIVITSNGTVNVPSGKRYAPIVTNVPQGITPSGSIEISENDTYDVTEYAEAVVNVPQGITPTGNINITDTNVTDVTNYATAQVVDADLVAENIKKDVNILGVVGSFEGGGGEHVFTDLPFHNLPTGYTEYLYLENSGTQYIDTGVVFNDLPTIETWAMRTNGTYDADIMGVRTAAEGGFIVNVGSNGMFYRYGTVSATQYRWNESGISAANFTMWQHIRYSTTVKTDMDLAFGAETTSATLGNFSNNTQSLLLFRGRDNLAYMRVGATKIYNGATLVRHLIPCMRNSDSILGMYDIINDAFYTNAGTGTFIGGALE